MKFNLKNRIIGAAILVGIITSMPFDLIAEDEEKKPSRRERLMQRFDKNKDGKLNEAEREAIRKLFSRSRRSGKTIQSSATTRFMSPMITIRKRSIRSS